MLRIHKLLKYVIRSTKDANSGFKVLLLTSLFCIVGCGDKDEVKVYRVDKEKAPAPSMSQASSQEAVAAPAAAELVPVGKVPATWIQQPLSTMRIASYSAADKKGASADISLVALGGAAGGVLDNVNRWLTQLGQPEISPEKLASLSQKVKTEIGEAIVVDLQGLPAGANPLKDGRIIAGIITTETHAYFFKLRGNKDVAGDQKKAFIQWISSVKMSPREAASSAPTAAGLPPGHPAVDSGLPAGHPPMDPGLPAGHPPMDKGLPAGHPAVEGSTASNVTVPDPSLAPTSEIRWKAPASWKGKLASSMRFASFTAENAKGEAADISVMVIPGQGGGDLENVNRWRGQVGLQPLSEGELKSSVSTVKVAGADFQVVDLKGAASSAVAAWVRYQGKAWFFKMSGPDSVVQSEKTRFNEFLKSVRFVKQ